MLNNELNLEELLKAKEDKKYKKTSISARSQTGDSDISYPTVGAVRDFVNYVKEDLEGYIDDSILNIDELIENKTNYISETYKNINKCTRMDTIYVINGIPNDAEILETGILLAAKVADNCAQYLFTNTGRFLIRQKINGEWNEKFTDVIPYSYYQAVQYKTQKIVGTTSPGHDADYYPSVGAVKEYVKAYYEDVMEAIEGCSTDINDNYYTKKEIDALLANKMNKQVGSYENINSYTKNNTLYTSIDMGENENGVHEYATVICVQGMNKANRYAQFAFTNLGRVLKRCQINGVWEETFTEV